MQFPDPLRRTLLSCRAILWLASGLVPREHRAEWQGQRLRRIWHWINFLSETGQLNRENKLELARHCWGAFADAFWVRYDRKEFLLRLEHLFRAPATCLAVATLLVSVVVLAGGFIPAAQSRLSSAISRPDRVCVVSLNGKFRRLRSETLLDLASAWKGSKLLSAVAPYSWGPGRLAGEYRTVPILTARVAPDFFELLGVNAAAGRTFRTGDAQTCRNCAVLSHEMWKLQFASAPGVIGQRIMLDGSQKTVIGVLPRNFHLVSSDIAAWTLLDPAAPPFSNFVERIGAVARMKNGATPPQIEADLSDLTENAGYVFPASLLSVISAQEDNRRSLETYLLFLLLAVTCAVWIVYARHSERGLGRAPTSLPDGCRWWLFFVAKSLLLLVATCLLASATVRWVCVHLVGSIYPMANGVALWFFLVLAIGPLSWSIHDQQKRCRTCLRRLGSPIRIGAPGHVLLNWSGTEMVCREGHGILYLPDAHADWLERDRWNTLDASWADLFRSPDALDKERGKDR
jgi:MacB-like periplasmic core domain